jgi:hypothetical protein
MIEAVGTYSEEIKGLSVAVSPTKTVEIKFSVPFGNLADGMRYRVSAEFYAIFDRARGSCFRVRVVAISAARDCDQDFAGYRGVLRLHESAGGMQERQGGELLFYRGDALYDDLREVDLDKSAGWITVTIPKSVSAYTYKAGDLLYVDGKVYHKQREVNGVTTYELCVRADICHKVDGTEYWERVRSARHRALVNRRKPPA